MSGKKLITKNLSNAIKIAEQEIKEWQAFLKQARKEFKALQKQIK